MNVINVEELGNISDANINTEAKTRNGIGLCYFEPDTELLKEFTSNITIPVFPMEESVRQFYIVRDDPTLKINTILFKAFSDSTDYEVKSALDNNSNYTDLFTNNEVLIFPSNYTNIIPINIYIKNIRYTATDLILNISMDIN